MHPQPSTHYTPSANPPAPSEDRRPRVSVSPLGSGVARGARWRARGAYIPRTKADGDRRVWATAYDYERDRVAKLPTAELLVQHGFVHRHTNVRDWTPADRATVDEIVARSWGVGQLSALRYSSCPRWVESRCFVVSPTGRRMHRAGWTRFLGWLIGAFRQGAAGVRIDLCTLGAELGVARSTAAKWVGEMLDAQLVAIVHTHKEVEADESGDGKRKRVTDRNLYQLGPYLLERHLALLEGDKSPERSPVDAGRCSFLASQERKFARSERCEREKTNRRRHKVKEAPADELALRLRTARPLERDHQGGEDARHKPRPPAPQLDVEPAVLDEIAAMGSARAPSQERTPSAKRSESRGPAPESESRTTTLRFSRRRGGAEGTSPHPGAETLPLRGRETPTASRSASVPETEPECTSAPRSARAAAPPDQLAGSRPAGAGHGSGTSETPPGARRPKAESTRDAATRALQTSLRRLGRSQGYRDGVPAFLRSATPVDLLNFGYDVPPDCLCPACEGRGKRKGSKHDCRACRGSGWRQ